MIAPLLCIVEDDPIMGESLADRFGLEGFAIDWHRTGEAALDALGSRPYAAVISDIRLPDLSGEELFGQLVGQTRRVPPFVFITGYGSIERAVALLKLGAADYITKPFDIGHLVDKIRGLTGARLDSPSRAETLLGVSSAMRALEAMLPRVASRATSIFITGESGVGKEVLARRIHAIASVSATGGDTPFIPVNCGALPEALLEAEFFGHEKGAFTGADRQKRGYFEQAFGGTLFLDEIGDLPTSMQVKLLRAIQERRVKRLGAESEIDVSFRLICATNRDLQELIRAGQFREDLYYRINVMQLHVPPLRERPEDVPWLVTRIVAEISLQLGETPKALHPSVDAALVAYPWPGNIRELRNRLERACILSERIVLLPQDIFEESGIGDVVAETYPASLEVYLAHSEWIYLQTVLHRHGGRISKTAEALGISRKNLWEKMRRHRLAAVQGSKN
jgi:DNA-binding NtrC family response regulator